MSDRERIRKFILDELMSGQSEWVGDEVDLLQSGILDSLALSLTVTFLEELTGVQIEPKEITPDNFRSIATIDGFAQRKKAEAG
jgi:acyl carrier protein